MSSLTKSYKGLLRTKPLKGPERSVGRIPFSGYPLRGFYLCLGILTTRKRVYKFLYADLVRHFVLLQLVLYVCLYCLLVSAYRIHKIPSCPKVPVPVLILQVGVSVKYHQAALSFQVSHNLGYAVLRWDAYQHVDVVWACLCFYDFYALLLAQLPQYNPYVLFYLSINLHPSIFRRKCNAVLNHTQG